MHGETIKIIDGASVCKYQGSASSLKKLWEGSDLKDEK